MGRKRPSSKISRSRKTGGCELEREVRAEEVKTVGRLVSRRIRIKNVRYRKRRPRGSGKWNKNYEENKCRREERGGRRRCRRR
jgi:hypothetical protein